MNYYIHVSLIFALLIGCVTANTYDSPNINNHESPELDFEEYQTAAFRHLNEFKKEIDERDKEKDIQLILPFEYKSPLEKENHGRFLMIHGITGTSYVWKEFAQELTEYGFDVRGILLSGHGTHPSDLRHASAQSWLAEVQAHVDGMLEESEEPLYIGGNSMGALIASIIAIRNPAIDGLLTVVPAYEVLLGPYLSFVDFVGFFTDWLEKKEEVNPVRYNSFPVSGAREVYLLLKEFKELIKFAPLKTPVFMALTTADNRIDVDYVRKFFDEEIRSRKKLITYSHFVLEPYKNEEIVSSFVPEERIITQSHISLLNSVRNPVFGKEGEIMQSNKEYFLKNKKDFDEVWFLEDGFSEGVDRCTMRTTYNPHFDVLVRLVAEFFQQNS